MSKAPGQVGTAAMDGIIGKRVLRCSDGHLFTSSQTSRLFGSVHLGPKRLMRCPHDGRFRIMSNVDSRDLTEAERLEAEGHHR